MQQRSKTRGLPIKLAGVLTGTLLLSACVGAGAPKIDSSGAATREYVVTVKNVEAVRGRALERLNQARGAAGVAPVAFDASLMRAADLHSGDMSAQRRAWAFGSDGSSPLARAERAGFGGRVIGEVVSQTYETEVQALGTWLSNPAQRRILLDPNARVVGLGIHQEDSGMLWWTMNVGQ